MVVKFTRNVLFKGKRFFAGSSVDAGEEADALVGAGLAEAVETKRKRRTASSETKAKTAEKAAEATAEG